MQMHLSVKLGILRPAWMGQIVERVVARLPVVQAPSGELGQCVQHGSSGGCDQAGPTRQFIGCQFASFPHRTGRVYQQMPSIGSVIHRLKIAQQGLGKLEKAGECARLGARQLPAV